MLVADDWQDGAEDFFLHDGRIKGDVLQDSRLDGPLVRVDFSANGNGFSFHQATQAMEMLVVDNLWIILDEAIFVLRVGAVDMNS